MKKTMPLQLPATVDPSWKIGIIAAQWHRDILEPMIAGAKKTLIDAGISAANVTVYEAAGSFEIPLIGSKHIEHVDALIGLGIVLQGETHHAEAIVDTAAQAMMDLQIKHGKPFAFEILHVHNLDQARERAHGDHNKGFEAARAVLWSLSALQKIH